MAGYCTIGNLPPGGGGGGGGERFSGGGGGGGGERFSGGEISCYTGTACYVCWLAPTNIFSEKRVRGLW